MMAEQLGCQQVLPERAHLLKESQELSLLAQVLRQLARLGQMTGLLALVPGQTAVQPVPVVLQDHRPMGLLKALDLLVELGLCWGP
jgi:hypothetical protein